MGSEYFTVTPVLARNSVKYIVSCTLVATCSEEPIDLQQVFSYNMNTICYKHKRIGALVAC